MGNADVVSQSARRIIAGARVVGTRALVLVIAVAVDAVLDAYDGPVLYGQNVRVSLAVGGHLLPVQSVAQDLSM